MPEPDPLCDTRTWKEIPDIKSTEVIEIEIGNSKVFEIPEVLELDDDKISWSGKCPIGMSIDSLDAPSFVSLDSTTVEDAATDITLTIEPQSENEEGEHNFWII